MSRPATYTSTVPVICIGNFTAGGTGKTPFVRVVVAMLRELGHTPVVLSRGYGGSELGPHWVDNAHDTAARAGDEPLLLAATVPVMVARDRVAGARAIEAASAPHPLASVIVMDDGLQNPALAKTLTIAVIDATRGVGNGHCIPAGPLRAPLELQLGHADALLFNRGDRGQEPSPLAAQLAAQFKGPVLSAVIAPAQGLDWLKGQKVIAFAGIGVPERFFATLKAAGATVCNAQAFADHHAYTADDAQRLLSLAKAENATLVTTEKDHVRLNGSGGALAELAAASRILPIELRLDAPSQATLHELLAQRCPIS